MTKRDYLSVDDLSTEELTDLLGDAAAMKAKPEKHADALAGAHVALVFEKPSTRTRVSMEVGVASLGGHPVVLRGDELQLGRGETIEDTGRVLSLYVDAIAVRTFGQERLEALAAGATVPVINLLSDESHPCQALADLLTIQEHVNEKLSGTSLAYLGDGNNVAHSLLIAGARMGMDVRVASPSGYQPDREVVERAREVAAHTGGRVIVTDLVAEAAEGADVLYTDVWASMGQEGESGERIKVLEGYGIDESTVSIASDDVKVMHCLPAHRGEEISAEVMDGDRSIVWDQAENRLHTQKALLVWLLAQR
ncbi:MAG TPA: ornithine carbamoyltransferase [Actinomycetota bacterium]|nr:ornithine carbamoyltransferase [Actinomycetota bacterium]